jgi:alpha-ketoglutarate-dependent taurine dioxygenase
MTTILQQKFIDFSTQSISKFQKLLKQNHYIYVDNDDPDFDWIKFCKSVTGYELIPQYGNEIFEVKWIPEFMNFSDARGAKPVLPHTEASDYPNPPKYMALWGKKPANCGGGMTTFAYVKEFLKTLTEEEKTKLTETTHYFGATNGVHANRTNGAIHPLLSFDDDNKPIFRFSYNYIKYGDYSPDPDNLKPFTPDSFLGEISDRFIEFYEQNHIAIKIKQHSFLLWDNQCLAHARTTYSDPTRELNRIFLG